MLLFIFLLCLTPVVVAYALHFLKPSWLGHRTTNHGELMQPARPLPPLALRGVDGKAFDDKDLHGHWSLLILGGAACDAACLERVNEVRNIRPLLREQRKRLQVYYIAPDAAALTVFKAAQAAGKPLPVLLAGDADARLFKRPAGSVVMIDPLGNWVLSYAPGAVPKDMYLDLRHLLRYSHIG